MNQLTAISTIFLSTVSVATNCQIDHKEAAPCFSPSKNPSSSYPRTVALATMPHQEPKLICIPGAGPAEQRECRIFPGITDRHRSEMFPRVLHGKYSLTLKSCRNKIDDFNGNVRINSDEIRFGSVMFCEILKRKSTIYKLYCSNEDPTAGTSETTITIKPSKFGLMIGGKSYIRCPNDE
jgi:hypothetical protein